MSKPTKTTTTKPLKVSKLQMRISMKQRERLQAIAVQLDLSESELSRDIISGWLRRNAGRFTQNAA